MPLNLSKLQQLREDQNKDKAKTKELPQEKPAIEPQPQPKHYGDKEFGDVYPDMPAPVDEYTQVMETIEVVEPPKPRTRKPRTQPQPQPVPEFEPQPIKPQTPPTPPKPPIPPRPTQPVFSVPQPNPQFTGQNSFFKNLASTMKEIKNTTFDELEDGSYTGFVSGAELRESQKGNKMVMLNIQINTKRGLPSDGEATKFFMLEHSNPQVVEIALRQIRNMLLTVGIVVDEVVDLEMIFNNLGDYWKNKPVTFEVKKGFLNIKEFNGKRA